MLDEDDPDFERRNSMLDPSLSQTQGDIGEGGVVDGVKIAGHGGDVSTIQEEPAGENGGEPQTSPPQELAEVPEGGE